MRLCPDSLFRLFKFNSLNWDVYEFRMPLIETWSDDGRVFFTFRRARNLNWTIRSLHSTAVYENPISVRSLPLGSLEKVRRRRLTFFEFEVKWSKILDARCHCCVAKSWSSDDEGVLKRRCLVHLTHGTKLGSNTKHNALGVHLRQNFLPINLRHLKRGNMFEILIILSLKKSQFWAFLL